MTYSELYGKSFLELKVIKESILDELSDVEQMKIEKIGEILYLQEKLRKIKEPEEDS